MELVICQQRPVRPQVIQAPQVRGDDADRHIRRLDCRRREEIEHVGAAVQNDVIHKFCSFSDKELYLVILQLWVGERVLPGGIAHDADERVFL